MVNKEGFQCLNISAKIESDIANLESEQEKKKIFRMYGLKESGLSK